MGNEQDIINKYNNIIIDVYYEHGLKCLRGLNGECKIDGKNIYTWHRQATHLFAEKNNIMLIGDNKFYRGAGLVLPFPFMPFSLDFINY